jgi:hypothetical protein
MKAQRSKDEFKYEVQLEYDCFYREAVTSQSPGLLQPWETMVSGINPERVAPMDATALRLNHEN